MSSAGSSSSCGCVSRGAIIAAVAVGVAGVAAYTLVKRSKDKDGNPKCPFSSSPSPAPNSAAASGKCPFSGATLPAGAAAASGCPHAAAAAAAAHGHGHGHGASAAHAASAGATSTSTSRVSKLAAILPFQPRAFTPEELALCTGGTEDPLGLLKKASVSDTLNTSTTKQAQLEDDLAVTDHMVCISVRGIIFKVTPQFYGQGEGYAVYAGKDISRCLAIGEVADAEANLPWNDGTAKAFKAYYGAGSTKTPILNADRAARAMADDESYDGEFSKDELHSLELWAQKYEKKYQLLGWFAPFAEDNSTPTEVCRSTKEVLALIAKRVDLTAPKASEGDAATTARRGTRAPKTAEQPPSSVL